MMARSIHKLPWIILIIVSGTCLTPYVTPFAALATLATLKLGMYDAINVIGLVWLADQVIGFGVLGYAWTWDTIAWGLVIGLSACLAIPAAAALSTTRPVRLSVSLPFVAAFATYQLGLHVAGNILPGSHRTYAIGHAFVVNAITLCSLLVVTALFRVDEQPEHLPV